MSRALGLALGFAADRLVGDPARFHPVAGFGRTAAWLERRSEYRIAGPTDAGTGPNGCRYRMPVPDRTVVGAFVVRDFAPLYSRIRPAPIPTRLTSASPFSPIRSPPTSLPHHPAHASTLPPAYPAACSVPILVLPVPFGSRSNSCQFNGNGE